MTAEAVTADPSTTFFDAAARGELLVQGCARCGHRQFYPRRWCLQCDSTDLDWVPVSGDGELVTFSVVRRAPSQAHKARLPYVVAIVRLVEGPQMMATIVNAEADDLIPGMAVRVAAAADVAPAFEPAGGSR